VLRNVDRPSINFPDRSSWCVHAGNKRALLNGDAIRKSACKIKRREGPAIRAFPTWFGPKVFFKEPWHELSEQMRSAATSSFHTRKKRVCMGRGDSSM
jgi:hypothetical protein